MPSQVMVPPSGSFVEWPAEEIEGSVPSRFEEMARRYPERLALKCKDQFFSYAALNRSANQLAHTILAQQGESQEPVALLLEHGPSVILAVLAVLKADKFYVPLDAAYPPARLAGILADSQTRLIITNRNCLSLAREVAPDGARLLELDALDAGLSEENVRILIQSDRLFNLTYTSGSTGQPKGVLQTHRNILHNSREATHLLKFTREDRFALTMPITFGASASDIFGALLNGAALLPYDLKTQGMAEFIQWLRHEKITVYHSVPTVYRHVLGMLGDGETLPDVRMIELGGEPLLKHDIDLFKKHFSDHCVLMNDLGTTETYLATAYLVDKATVITGPTVPVGYPLNGRHVFILNDSRRRVSAGEIGQIAVKSRYLSPGYWRRPDLSEAAFLPDPEGGEERTYLMGDLGRQGPDGCLEYLGRKDDMIKIRGQRVAAAEVETALLDLDGIREAVVIAQAGPRGDNFLVAYIVPTIQPAPTVSALRQVLAQTLPDFMIPSVFVIMDEFPLLPFGKVDRRALPAPDWTRPELQGTYVAPRGEPELQLTRIWEEILGIQPIGVTDNFFDLGGHSLLTARLFAEIEKKTGKDLPQAALFQAPTIERLAAVLRQEGWSAAWNSLVALQPHGSKPPFFCIPGILGNVFTDLGHMARYLGPGQPFYGLQDSVRNPAQIKVLATRYLDEIRRVQPEGPYFLGGICSGGIVAFEMAQQLQAKEQPVALLAMIETPYLGTPGIRSFFSFASFTISRMLRRSGHHSRNAARYGFAERRAYIRLKIKQTANEWALTRYAPQPYPGQVHLFMTDESFRSPDTRFLRWRELATGGAEIHVIPGRHDTIVGSHVQVDTAQMSALAERLRTCIDETLADGNSR
jgi:amino acid adenylation domain-containing protein